MVACVDRRPARMTILHIVLLEPKQGVGQAAIDDVRLRGPLAQSPAINLQQACEGMRALQTKCVNPSTQKPYIKSLTGGKNNSIEAFKVCLTYHRIDMQFPHARLFWGISTTVSQANSDRRHTLMAS